jgi:uncharacterized membrane protein YccC
VATIWSALFTVGNVLYGRWNYAAICLAVFIVAVVILLRVVSRIWSNNSAAKAAS